MDLFPTPVHLQALNVKPLITALPVRTFQTEHMKHVQNNSLRNTDTFFYTAVYKTISKEFRLHQCRVKHRVESWRKIQNPFHPSTNKDQSIVHKVTKEAEITSISKLIACLTLANVDAQR